MSKLSCLDLILFNSKLIDNYEEKVYKCFIDFGWGPREGCISTVLLAGDKDGFNWSECELTDNDIFSLAARKKELKEVSGVVMFWQDTNIGGSFLINNDGIISIQLNINRLKVDDCDFTDVSWYLKKIIPALSAARFSLDSYCFLEA